MIFVPKNRHLHSKLAVKTCSLSRTLNIWVILINNSPSDDNDIQREIRSMFVRYNLIIRRFFNCSKAVKLKLFQLFCLCFYDIALWSSFHKSYLHKFKCCYNKCVKLFFGYRKHDSVTQALFETRVQSFETVLHNARCVSHSEWTSCCNRAVSLLCNIKIR